MYFPLAEREIWRASETETEALEVIEKMYANYKILGPISALERPARQKLSTLFIWDITPEGHAFWMKYGWN